MNCTNLAHLVTACLNITAICIVSRLFDISNIEPFSVVIAAFICVLMFVFDVFYVAFVLGFDFIANFLMGDKDE